MERKIRWGIIGTGNIARTFAESLMFVEDAELTAVGSRAVDTARQFAEAFKIGHWYASYEELVNDPDVDVVYVSTPHPFHMENTLLCLKAGKAVLCEKPFAMNAGQAQEMIDVAKSNKLFLMEAMWTRFLPIIVEVRKWLRLGVIGDVRMLQSDFGVRFDWEPNSRIFNPQLGGGALLDLGVYQVSLASMIFAKPPVSIAGLAHIGQTGVDEQSGVVLKYNDGGLAILSSAIRTQTPGEAVIFGAKGKIRIHPPFWCSTVATLSIEGKEDQTVEMPLEGKGYCCEAREVVRCMQDGKLESDVIPLEETLAVMKILDQIREQWGLKYPME